MFVLKSTFDQTAKIAKAACISRDLWKAAAKGFEERALAAEGEIARRAAQARANFAKGRETQRGKNLPIEVRELQ